MPHQSATTHVQGVLVNGNDFLLGSYPESDANVVSWTEMSLLRAVMDSHASHSAPPRMAIHVFFQRHVSHGQPTPTVIWCRRMRGDTSPTFASGAWYGARAAAHRSLPGPTSAHCESLCGQDRLGGSDECGGADRDGRR